MSIKDIDEKSLDDSIDASIDKMYSRIDSLDKRESRVRGSVASRLKAFDSPEIELDELPDISRLRSRLDRLKDYDSFEDSEADRVLLEKVDVGEIPKEKSEIEPVKSFHASIKKVKELEPEIPEATKKPAGAGSEKKEKKGLFGSFKKKMAAKKEAKKAKKEEEKRKAAEEERKKPKPDPEPEPEPLIEKQPRLREEPVWEEEPAPKKKKRKAEPVFAQDGIKGTKEYLDLRERLIRRRQKRLLKSDKRHEKLKVEQKKLVIVSDKLKIREEMATDNERHIVDNLAMAGVKLAPIYKRFLAYLIDSVVILVLAFVLELIISGMIDSSEIGLWLVLYYMLVAVLYFSLVEATYGRGLGKWIMHLYTTNTDFEYVTIGSSFVQAFFKIFPLCILDVIFAMLNPLTKQRLSNKWSGTIVISEY